MLKGTNLGLLILVHSRHSECGMKMQWPSLGGPHMRYPARAIYADHLRAILRRLYSPNASTTAESGGNLSIQKLI